MTLKFNLLIGLDFKQKIYLNKILELIQIVFYYQYLNYQKIYRLKVCWTGSPVQFPPYAKINSDDT